MEWRVPNKEKVCAPFNVFFTDETYQDTLSYDPLSREESLICGKCQYMQTMQDPAFSNCRKC